MNFDAVEQYNLFTGAMDAEYNLLGLVQNMVTRSAGNNFTPDASAVISRRRSTPHALWRPAAAAKPR